MYDLLIKGGRVIDPAQNIDGQMDIGISGGKVAKLDKDIPAGESQQVFDAKGKIVTPGLIDMHCHVYDSIYKRGAEPDAAGVRQGVTTVVDGGTAGEATFRGFPKYVIPASRTTVFCFLNLSATGLNVQPELRDWNDVDLDAIEEIMESNLDLIKGIKLRLVGNLVASEGIEIVKIAKKAAKKFGLPVMVHIGDRWKQVSPALTQEFLPLMEPGDILSHPYTPQPGSALLPDGTFMPELKEAMERGVVMDVANGPTGSNFSFEVARKGLAQGIFPTVLSTDVNLPSLTYSVYGMTMTMSKFLALGLNLGQVIEMSTINPARAIREEQRIGSLKPGMNADISILELLSGTWDLGDPEQPTIDKLISPVMTIKSGQEIPADPVAQP
ncbi:amidohydrolase/deacetylase family metallohydrolase [Chloroflexota bacterium]